MRTRSLEGTTKTRTLVLNHLLDLEREGKYKECLEKIHELLSEFQEFTKSEAPIYFELTLRQGAVLGFLGSLEQSQHSQEESKRLLSIARNGFVTLQNNEKVAECENYLALAYWRMSSYDDALIWLENAFFNNPKINEVRLHSFVIESLILLSQKKYNEIIDKIELLLRFFLKNGNAFLLGCIATNLGLAYKNLSNNKKSIDYLLKAKIAHRESGHMIYLASVENNLAQVYRLERLFKKAHKYIDSALSYTEINKRCRAINLDTKALIFFDEGKYLEALDSVNEAIELLKGDDYNFLTGILQTKIKILLELKDFRKACITYAENYSLLISYSDEKLANQFTDEFLKTLKSKFTVSVRLYEEYCRPQIELSLPEDLAVGRFYAVRMNSNDLESIGIKLGMVLLVIDEPIKKGDLVVISDKDKEIVIGFFDKHLGLIGIKKPTSQPLIFEETEVKVLGKVRGYGIPQISNKTETVDIVTFNLDKRF